MSEPSIYVGPRYAIWDRNEKGDLLDINGREYSWDANDVVWRKVKPENDHDDGYRKIGVLKYEYEDDCRLKAKLINFLQSIKEI